MKRPPKKPLVCSHCDTEISGGRYIEKESGIYMGEEEKEKFGHGGT